MFCVQVPAFELPELPVPRQPTIKSFVRGSEDTFASPLLTPYELINKLISDPLFEFPGGGDEFHVDDMPTERFRSFGESPLSLAELAKDPLAKVLGSNEWKVWPKFGGFSCGLHLLSDWMTVGDRQSFLCSATIRILSAHGKKAPSDGKYLL